MRWRGGLEGWGHLPLSLVAGKDGVPLRGPGVVIQEMLSDTPRERTHSTYYTQCKYYVNANAPFLPLSTDSVPCTYYSHSPLDLYARSLGKQ